MSAHTPGPWYYGEFELYEGAKKRFNIAQVAGAPYTEHYSDVANTIGGEDMAVQEANARLIAAAPCILDALQEAKHMFAGEYPGHPTTERIFAAIEKATGKPA